MFKNQTRQLVRLPAGFSSYLRSLAAMAAFVRASAADYDLKLYVNNLFRRAGVSGHDFEKEIATLFFSLVMGFVTRVTRLTLSLYKTRGAQLKRRPVTATIKSLYWLQFLRCPALHLGLLSAALTPMNRCTFGLKSI